MPNDQPIPIGAITHGRETRPNIPTAELEPFAAVDESAPKSMLYPRDPSLDPQLVWKGKDAQDRDPLTVPAVPIYIQEKIAPRALIEDLRATARHGAAAQQLNLFADFNGLAFDQLVDFYQHSQHWTNRLILGDALLVMTSLAEKEGLKGKVQTIYMDPPYGIKFGSNWQVSTRKRDVRDGKVEDVTRQPEQIRAFRDTWELGIHSYLTFLRDRLTVARDLLTETGSIFIQIGDENAHLVRCLLDEVFGIDNFISQIVFTKTGGQTADLLPGVADHILWFAKNIEAVKYRRLFVDKIAGGEGGEKYYQVELSDGSHRTIGQLGDVLPSGARAYRLDNLMSQSVGREKGEGAASWFPVNFAGRRFLPNIQNRWKTNEAGMERLKVAGRLEAGSGSLSYVRFLDDFPAFTLNSVWTDIGGIQSRSDPKVYVVQTATKVVERCLLMTTDPGDLILDPTCGSGTTAYVAEQWGRRWITIDTSRVALAIARTRLMAARYPWYLLAASAEGARKESELSGQPVALPVPEVEGDVRQGFVYRRVPHITLRSIAHNEEIDTIHARWQPQIDALRDALNQLCGTAYEEWELPREPVASWPERAAEVLADWWRLRRERQREIDASIARHGDQEQLYDQPFEDLKRVRVSGPFTVESLAPHRMITPEEDDAALPASERAAAVDPETAGRDSFEATILEYLRRAGVQNTVREERLVFDRLELFAGEWLQAEGEYTDKGGQFRRVALAIGPEHGTVGPELVKEAAKEAMRGAGFDLLVVLGFAFDAYAGEAAEQFSPPPARNLEGLAVAESRRRYGKLQVMLARMNPDLAMGDDLLKKTGAANLFMVFGEPDIEVRHEADGQLVAALRGVDVYDPTTGEIRSSSTDDIACWFIDTDYNEESFFVRHAYFTGADEPYTRLKRALRAEIDEAAWASVYRTESRPFPRPQTGKIAIKVINHYGDEVLKVLRV